MTGFPWARPSFFARVLKSLESVFSARFGVTAHPYAVDAADRERAALGFQRRFSDVRRDAAAGGESSRPGSAVTIHRVTDAAGDRVT